ncbi:MAG: Mur ligase family protein [Patescibacteria group bacterium]
MFETYKQDIAFLEGLANIPRTGYLLGPKDKSIFIKRVKNFLTLVGDPQKNLKFIHITGTSGKGSTVKVLESLIADAHFKVGSFTSPFATTTLEKISINNKLISTNDFHNILTTQIKPALDKYILKFPDSLSYFEIWLVIGFLYFKKQKCDWVVLEAGLGGLHDATNVIEKPKITAITNVGLDHTHILGKTKAEIATDKAGIIKKNSIFLTNEKNKKLLKIFASTCRQKKAWLIKNQNLVKNYKTANYFSTIKQKENLNLALNILEILKINPPHVQNIIDNFGLICRQEIMQKNPLVILDGSHNKDKLDNIINFAKLQSYQKLHLVLAFAQNKNYKIPLKKLLQISDNLYLTRFMTSVRKSAELKKLYQASKKINAKLPISLYHDPYQALEAAMSKAKKDDLVLVTGSFFLTGELRKKWIAEDYILKNRKLDKK